MSLFFIQQFNSGSPPNGDEPTRQTFSPDSVAETHQQTISKKLARRKFYQNIQHVQERYQQNHRLFF